MTGIEKEIDSLGRVLIPAKLRKKLGVKSKAKVFVSLEDDVITIALTSKYCALCGKQIGNEHKLRLCSDCILKIQSEASVEKD